MIKKITTPDDLIRIKKQTRTFEKVPEKGVHVAVGMNTCGMASGAKETMAAFRESLAYYDLDAKVFRTGCAGMCFYEPLVDVFLPGQPRITYKGLSCDGVSRVVEDHILGGQVVENWVLAQTVVGDKRLPGIPTYDEIPYCRGQHKIVLARCGHIDPEDIYQYIAMDGYAASAKALEMDPEQVIDTIRRSGLRGRGGAGFPTGLKWQFVREAKGHPKYIICNADEGDPGAFMDRSILEGDPHAVLEGMLIAAYAVGATRGYIYVRAEYPLAVERLRKAIQQACDLGLLGPNIFGSDFSFDIRLKLGAGAFVCGEETALIASIEGKRGMPHPRPPFPAQNGLWGKPTNINNVETYANVAPIISNGAEWYAAIGTPDSRGTKVFCVTGKIKHSGLIEVPMGTSLRKIVYDIGGGITAGRAFKAVQTGGPSGGVLPEALLDLGVGYKELAEAGSIMGSGGMVVMDENTCMADVARYFLSFTRSESCGKCTPCREGLTRLYEILDRICKGNGHADDLDRLESLATTIKDTALCGLGLSAPNPVLTVLKYFREEIEAHIFEQRCPAGVCPDLVWYRINADRCSGCGQCRRACPVEAIVGRPKVPHEIDRMKCVKCGTCLEVCPPRFHAVECVSGQVADEPQAVSSER
ncbi:MAG: NADH-quinone oxidoreductase subunit NuoF [Deltaproteobacteria bacterium]|nr:NADH-quinone oxidoreductase subunit NuoF [Deltaproteobacteria bacterium]